MFIPRSPKSGSLLALLAIPVVFLLLAPSAAFAATQTVSNLNDSGAGSLRQAMIDAQANGDTGNVINFTVNGTVNLMSPLPLITKTLTVRGTGADVLTVRRADAAPDFRIFEAGFGVFIVAFLDLTISNGVADFGGGIFSGTDLVVTRCVLSENTAAFNGGAIDMGLTIAYAAIQDCAIINNTAGSRGGGIHYACGRPPGPVCCNGFLYNTTMSGNSAPLGSGVTITAFSGFNVALDIESCTVAENTSGGAGVRSAVVDGTATIGLLNTIVAKNDGAQLESIGGGILESHGHNLLEDNSGVGGFFPSGLPNGNDDYVGTPASLLDPLLGDLSNNGGPTPSHPLLYDSPAIDVGSSTRPTDQRGQPRVLDGEGDGMAVSDIGAFELRRYPVTTLADSGVGSLRQAILDNNTVGAGFIDIGVPGTINLLSVLPELDRSTAIVGLGANRTDVHRDGGAPSFRVFRVKANASVIVSSLTVSNGKTRPPLSAGGAGIQSFGDLTVKFCTIRDNDADFDQVGGGVSSESGNLTLLDSSVIDNNAAVGSGISFGGPGRMVNCTVSGNDNGPQVNGGAVSVGDSCEILNCTIAANYAVGMFPGGHAGRVIALANTIVAGNTAGDMSASLAGTLVTLGGNFIGCNDDVTSVFPAGLPNLDFDFVGTSGSELDPGLGPLALYGGPTPCHALLAESMAVDRGRIPQGLSLPSTDQRGRTRTADGRCDNIVRIDSGAYELGQCRIGNVNGSSGVSQDVLLVNGSAGVGPDRRVVLGVGQQIDIELQASLAGPENNTRYFIYVWLGDTASPASFNVGGTYFGVLVNPGPIQGGTPQPFRCLRGTGISSAICRNVQELAAPDRAPFVLTDGNGVQNPNFKFTLQGMIEDHGSGSAVPFSVTNAVIVQF